MEIDDVARRRLIEMIGIVLGDTGLNFNVRLPDGYLLSWSRYPQFTLILNDAMILPQIILRRDDYFAGQAFIEKRWDIEGDIFDLVRLGRKLEELRLSTQQKFRLFYLIGCSEFYFWQERLRTSLTRRFPRVVNNVGKVDLNFMSTTGIHPKGGG